MKELSFMGELPL